ncbi:transporter substrate-binding domain-containing protein [Lactobacillus psittaci]|uniref:L-cystine-binding protein TcyA n=1 Tax=Lactobacillus psittaci DSM 15354 TaxID=1122152 RepID=A0A0R1SAN8_9LACO|nr:transporter substrate-binding domain-containing protein [Lactobacillus psittaci]KRL63786.1 L-cystine-binding protein TcyA [Lactobacillus psittaci DSM 15354]
MKSWIKKIGIIAGLGILSVGIVACSNQKSSEVLNKSTLTVGLEGTYAPYSYRQNGKLTGFEVELAKNVAKKLNYKVKFVPTKWDSLIAGIGAKKFDIAINDIAMTPEREKAYAFSTPYIYSKSALIMKNSTSLNSIKDIKGKKIAAATGTANADNVKKFGGDNVSSTDFSTAMELVRQNRVVAALNSKEAFLYFAKSQHVTDLKYKTIPTSQIASQGIGIMMAKNNKSLQKRINKALAQMRADGSLKKLSIKYFGDDITNK